ncbi:MAG TPA: hypothetical protein VHM92_06280 [Allosphingosinicella sp.]|nr:hypothetical protein [Allosphingosinicella sp.]
MTAVGLLGILLALLAFPLAAVHRTPARVTLFTAAFVAHIVTTVVYYFYSQTTSADTVLYYYDPYEMFELPMRPGTAFLVHMVQTMKAWIGGTYLDYFMIFQAIGFWGIVFLMRTVEEIHVELQVPQGRLAYIMLFLPGIYFWTSAIGKDAPLFFGCAAAVWASMRLRSRFLLFAFAILVMMLFRPHIALAALVALAATAFLDRRSRGYVKVLLFIVAIGGAGAVAGTVETALNVNVASVESVGEFFSRQAEVTQQVGGTTQVQGSFPVRLFSLLARPFFFDAQGLFGLIASFENILILTMLGTIARRFGDSVKLFRGVFFLRFGLIFTIVVTLLLAMVYYNVGLGLRQKMMFMPGLIAFYTGLLAYGRAGQRSAQLQAYADERLAADPIGA